MLLVKVVVDAAELRCGSLHCIAGEKQLPCYCILIACMMHLHIYVYIYIYVRWYAYIYIEIYNIHICPGCQVSWCPSTPHGMISGIGCPSEWNMHATYAYAWICTRVLEYTHLRAHI